jgi:hypothetical protein
MFLADANELYVLRHERILCVQENLAQIRIFELRVKKSHCGPVWRNIISLRLSVCVLRTNFLQSFDKVWKELFEAMDKRTDINFCTLTRFYALHNIPL